MKSTLMTTLVTMLLASVLAGDAWARGGIGGGASRGPAGGVSRPSAGPSVSRTPSLSRTPSSPAIARPASVARPASPPSISRPSVGGGASAARPSIPARPTPPVSRPSISDSRPGTVPSLPRPGDSRPGVSERPSVGSTRPSTGQLQDFLDLPGRPGVSTRPTVPDRPLVIDRPNASTRPGVIERPGVSTLPGLGDRPSTGDRPAVGDRPGITTLPAPIDRPGSREERIDAIRDRWNRPIADRPFDRDWWIQQQTNNIHWHWHAGWQRYPGSWWWRPCAWGTFGNWFTWTWANPYNYSYGTTIIYRDNYIYVNDQRVATVEAYREQATTIAENVPEDFDGGQADWLPLGVFAISEESATDTGMLLQLAVSRDGVISGALYNEITGSVRPLVGSVDQSSQRAAWRFADDEQSELIMETGIYNLTRDEATALLHFGSGKIQTWLLVRLPEPEEQPSTDQPE